MSDEVHLCRVPVEGELLEGRAAGRRYAVARLQGEVFALDAWCNHAGCLLSEGLLSGGAVHCPCHKVAFRMRDGRVLTEPRICDDQPVASVIERDGEVYLILEEAP